MSQTTACVKSTLLEQQSCFRRRRSHRLVNVPRQSSRAAYGRERRSLRLGPEIELPCGLENERERLIGIGARWKRRDPAADEAAQLFPVMGNGGLRAGRPRPGLRAEEIRDQ